MALPPDRVFDAAEHATLPDPAQRDPGAGVQCARPKRADARPHDADVDEGSNFEERVRSQAMTGHILTVKPARAYAETPRPVSGEPTVKTRTFLVLGGLTF